MLWHLLSLDAPTVACLWTAFVGWAAGVRISLVDVFAMFLAVWILYTADRLLDARPLLTSHTAPDLEERHRFHHRHRARLLPLIVVTALPLTLLLHYTQAAVLHLHVMLASLLAGWLLLVHAGSAPSTQARRLPKELAVGIFFPAAIFIPSVARAPSLRPALLPDAVLFAAVCTLNCLFLYAWEHPRDRSRAHTSTRWSVAHLKAIAVTSMLLAASLVLLATTAAWHLIQPGSLAHPTAIPLAAAASIALLLWLHGRRKHLRPVRLRAWADLVLLTPLPICLAFHLRTWSR